MFTHHDFSTEQIQQFRDQLKRDGYLFLADLPEGFDHFYFVQEFGKLMPQYDGRIVWAIEPKVEFDEHYHSLNTKKLSPHTECYEYPGMPPKFLSLWCKQPAECGGGQTTLLDVRPFIDELAGAERLAAHETKVSFVSSSGIQSTSLGKKAEHTLVTDTGGEHPVFRFSRNCVESTSPEIDAIGGKLVERFEQEHMAITWKKNSFLIWDNHRVLHSRTAFTDRNRKLERVWLVDAR